MVDKLQFFYYILSLTFENRKIPLIYHEIKVPFVIIMKFKKPFIDANQVVAQGLQKRIKGNPTLPFEFLTRNKDIMHTSQQSNSVLDFSWRIKQSELQYSQTNSSQQQLMNLQRSEKEECLAFHKQLT